METQNETDNLISILFQVNDTGIGIPDDKLDGIFESFRQADGSTTRKYGGTGLGLAITKKLIDLMEGTINLTSKVDVGSSFSFELTFPKASFPLPDRDHMLPGDLMQGQALMIDNNRTALEIYGRLLKKRKLDIISTVSIEEGISILKDSASISLVLVSLNVLEHNGVNYFIELNEAKALADMMIIVMLPAITIESKIKLERLGIDDYIVKPFRYKTILDKINLACEKSLYS